MKNFKEMVYKNLFEGKRKQEFPDLNDDGKITKADVLIGRGVELKEEKEVATDEEIKKVVIGVLNKEGGASGSEPIKAALKKLNLPEDFNLEDFLDSLPDDEVKRHELKDYIEMTGLKEENNPTERTAEKIGRDQYVDETAGTVNFISAEELEKLLADTAMSDKKVVPDLSYEIKSFTEGEQDGTKVLGLKMVNDVVYFKTNEEEDGPDQGVYYKISV